MPESIETKRKFDARDFNYIAEYISDEFHRRKRARADRERQWNEIDRQVAMEPDVSYKKDRQGKVIPHKAWMSEIELPLQAQTLEVLVADARRMMFPDSGPWFTPHALLSDEYLQRADFTSLVAGDLNDVPSRLDQDNADKLVGGWLSHLHRQYELTDHVNRINAEAFKYGVGIGRVRNVTKDVFADTARGVIRKKTKFPVLFPFSIKNTYLDDTAQMAMNEGYILGPSTIRCWKQKLADLKMAANKGSKDPDDENGGWMASKLQGMDGNERGEVEVIEYEGDMVVPRATVRSLHIPNVIVTTVEGKKDGKAKATVVRLRFRSLPYSSYLCFPYHHEDVYSPYAAGPLLKGRPIQMGASQAFNRLMDSAALSIEPPIGWDSSDLNFAAEGGPLVHPGAAWGTISDLQVHNDIGDPAGMLNAFIALKQMYDDETGVNAPRLGAQTVSHTTAYAKQQELSRGAVRTVDYVGDTLKGPITTFLYMEYEMSRQNMKGEHTFYIDAYRGFVTIDKDHLPDMAVFEAHGAGGPAEEQAKLQAKMAALMQAIQIDVLRQQGGQQPNMNTTEIQKQLLSEGGWADYDVFFNQPSEAVSAGTGGEPGVESNTALPPGPATAAIQGLENEG